MILQALDALYDRLKDDESYLLPPSPRFSRQKITFQVVLAPDGRLLEIQDVRQAINGRSRPLQLLVLGATKKSGKGMNPCFLWDNAQYLLGYAGVDGDEVRTKRQFQAFRDRHLAARDAIPSHAYAAVCKFLESWHPERAAGSDVLEDAAKTGFGVFKVQGEEAFVHQDPLVVRWWERRDEDEGTELAECLVTGELASVARLHGKIRGVVGAQGAGATIVGFNEPAYESYGKEQSYNAPVSRDAAFRYVAALNSMLDGPRQAKHRILLGNSTVAFWTDRPSTAEDVFALFAGEGSVARAEPADEGLRAKLEVFLRALREGRERYGDLGEEPDRTAFYLLGLVPNAARVSVRFFHQGTLADLLENLRRHHQDIAVQPRRDSDPELPALWMLLRETARESKDVPDALAAPLLEAVVTGRPYPTLLYSAVLRRIRADQQVRYLRACVVKGYLNRNCNQEVTMALDPERMDPPYRLGRLFAALEKTQEDALGGNIGTSIRDSFYSSASATPRAVFPRILRTYQHHLAKLEGGRRVNREKLVQSIFESMRDFPSHLGLSGQGLFAIGYYHQRQDFFTKRDVPRDDEAASDQEN